MLKIREEQLFIFSERLTEEWIDRALILVQKHWPDVYGSTAPAALRSRIRNSLLAARAEGIDDSGDALRYLNLTLLLGDHFTTNGRYPWAAQIAASRVAGHVKTALLMEAVRDMIESSSR